MSPYSTRSVAGDDPDPFTANSAKEFVEALLALMRRHGLGTVTKAFTLTDGKGISRATTLKMLTPEEETLPSLALLDLITTACDLRLDSRKRWVDARFGLSRQGKWRRGAPKPHTVDPRLGAVRQLIDGLEDIRAAAGNPSFHHMAANSGLSAESLGRVLYADSLPRWERVEAFVRACGRSPEEWRPRWDAARAQVRDAFREDERWRTLLAYLYAANGHPAVPGYSRKAVRDRLSGDLPLDGEFVDDVLGACKAAAPPAESQSPVLPPEQDVEIVDAETVARVQATFMESRVRTILESMITTVDDDTDPCRALQPAKPDLMFHGPGGAMFILEVKNSTIPMPESSAVALVERVTELTSPTVGPPRPAPPDPETAVDPAGFVRLMNELKDWSQLSLRKLAEAAKSQKDYNLPHSSLGDALKKNELPRASLLWALTGAAGLPQEHRERWAAVRDRLEATAVAAVAAPREQIEPAQRQQDAAAVAPPPDPRDNEPLQPAGQDTHHVTNDLAEVLETYKQRLSHQCGYRGVCVEGIGEQRAADLTIAGTRAWSPGVASTLGREQLASSLLAGMQYQPTRKRRRLRQMLEVLIGAQTVDLMEQRLRVPDSDFDPEIEKARREVVERRLGRESAVRDGRYVYAAAHGSLGVVSISGNDAHNHPAYVASALEVIEAMSKLVRPDRPWWTRAFIGRDRPRPRGGDPRLVGRATMVANGANQDITMGPQPQADVS